MDPDMEVFISNLGDDEFFTPNQQMNQMWKELEDYMDKELVNIDEFLDELLPVVEFIPPLIVNDVQAIKTPSQISTKDLIKSFGLGEDFYKNVVADPKLDFKNKNFVPHDLQLNLIRSRVAEFSFQHDDHMFEKLESSQSPMLPRYNGVDSNDNNRPGQVPSEETLTAFDCLETVDNEWYNLLEAQQIYPGITVDSIVENIMRNQSTSQRLPRQDEIVRIVSQLLKVLNNFINRLSAEFTDYKFFDASQFATMGHNIQEEMLSLLNIKADNLLQILTKWIRLITEKFVELNDQRRQVEENVFNKIIDRAVEMYKSQLESVDPNKNISIVRKEKMQKFCLGMRHTYLSCGPQFNANILGQLEERLEEVNSKLDKPVQNKNIALKDYNVLIKLFVSEYVSSINQKGLQCAGISTLYQFDDVNKNCLADVKRRFAKEVIGVSSDMLNDLKKKFQSMLDAKLSTSSGVMSPSKTTPFHSVGIHFGFETLSVSYFIEANNYFRTIYGPSANVVSFVPQGILIGDIKENWISLNMEKLLTELDVGVAHETKYHGRKRLEEVIALILMQIDQITKQSLRTSSKIKYSIAIPSCFNQVMQNTFHTAMNIADIEGNLVWEQCALTTRLVSETHKAIIRNKDEFIITLIENTHKSCDSVRYKIVNGKKIIVEHVSGSDENNGILSYVFRKKLGIQLELDSIKSLTNKSIRFIVSSSDKEITKKIKNQFYNSKVHVSSILDSNHVANGAAILSALSNADNKLNIPFDLRHLTSIKPISGIYRLKHHGTTNPEMLQEIKVTARSLIQHQLEEFEKRKAAVKPFLMSKMKDLEDYNFSKNDKQKQMRDLEKDLKAVEEERANEMFIESIANRWKN